ncbi:UNVERIFIED_CONTAM: hypothetical protein PYX00_002126 [Menopon gallinae]|uniref:WW domain-containing protein n=1 Tax=Menopon gallinae TaxID=328185 RepID=A0AAW2IHQ4_9NEOP
MTFSPTSRQIVLQEVFDEASVPTDEEIHDYALKIGINVENEPHLLYLARDGLMEALPHGWKPCYDEDRGEIYYFNFKTGKAQWEHPLDEVYRNLVKKVRNETVATTDQVDDDSRTSIKEDLKSFEEASLILPSSEMYSRPKVLEPLSPLGIGTFKKSPTSLAPIKKSPSKEPLKSGILKLPINIDEEPSPTTKISENDLNPSKKITFDETEVRKRPNSSDIRNRRNIGPVEFRHLSKQEIIIPKHFGKSSFQLDGKKLSEFSKMSDPLSNENKTSESTAVTKDEGYVTEFSVSSMGDKENEMRGSAGKKELTLTGGGSVFLKTNKNKFSPSSDLVSLSLSKEELSDGLGSSMDGKKSSSDMDSNSKGILREQKFIKSSEKQGIQSRDEFKILSRKNSQEDRKSVRFNIEKDLKINFELPLDYRTESGDAPTSDSRVPKVKSLTTVKPTKSDANEKSKQIEIDFEDLNIDFNEDIVGDTLNAADKILSTDPKTVKPKKFKSSQALVQEFREIFEAKSSSKINISSLNISSPLKVDETVTKHSEDLKENAAKNYTDEAKDVRHGEKLNSDRKSGSSLDSGRHGLHNLIDLADLGETKDLCSSVDSQKDSARSDHSFRLRDELFDTDFTGLVDFALKKKIFESTSTRLDSPKDTPKPRSILKEKNILDEILRVDDNDIMPNEDKLLREELLYNLKTESDHSEKKSEDASGRYEKRKNEKLKSLEANFNEWLSETEKQFEDKKSNALIKMKEKYEDWKTNRETELAKIYSKKEGRGNSEQVQGTQK